MSRLVGFLQDDLKEIDESFENIKEMIDYRLHYEDSKNIEKHIEKLEQFISYWQQHSNKLKEQDTWSLMKLKL